MVHSPESRFSLEVNGGRHSTRVLRACSERITSQLRGSQLNFCYISWAEQLAFFLSDPAEF